VQGLLGEHNTKARFIDNVPQALDAMQDPLAHDFVKDVSVFGLCVICNQHAGAHESRIQIENQIRHPNQRANQLIDYDEESLSGDSDPFLSD